MGSGGDLAADSDSLSSLYAELDDMQRYLQGRVERLDDLVDGLERGWNSPAATTYRQLQRSVNEDAERIREMLRFIAEAVRLSRDGFSRQDLDVLARFRALYDVPGSPDKLSRATAPPEPSVGGGRDGDEEPRSRLADF
ncbi:WXG100 family type VII secretion target [Streptantibioticus parmotrematis]|uniref:WXG100 family type VII secretion target n=1 Tax=Streptantibioticus parmotrematis TaxID=2873249 RepID=UPI0033DBB046